MKRLLTLFLGFCSLLPLQAQPGTAQASTFRIISSSGSYPELLYDVGSGSQKKTVAINLNQDLSAPLTCPPKNELELYRLIPPPPGSLPGAKPTRQVITSVKLPENQSDCIVVTFPTTESKTGPLAARVVPPSPVGTHQAGTVKVINFSDLNAAVGMDDRMNPAAAGSIGVIKAGTGRVLFQVAVSKGSVWAKAFRGERRLAPQLRGYVFVFNYRVDPDYGSTPTPPPAIVKTFFEVSPETLTPSLAQK